MGAGAVLPGGNLSSAAAAGWLLRRHEIGTRPLLTRCAALLCLLTAFGFIVNGLAGVLLLAGVSDGPHDLLHAGGPILVSIAVLSLAALLAVGIRRVDEAAPRLVREIAAGARGRVEVGGCAAPAAARHGRVSLPGHGGAVGGVRGDRPRNRPSRGGDRLLHRIEAGL